MEEDGTDKSEASKAMGVGQDRSIDDEEGQVRAAMKMNGREKYCKDKNVLK